MSKRKSAEGQLATENGEQKPKESKADRFRRLAGRRVTVAIKRLQHVANLGNRSQYEYTEEQAGRVVAAIKDAASRVETAFTGSKAVADFFQV